MLSSSTTISDTTTSIDKKKIKKSHTKTSGNKWGAFATSVLGSFIFTLIVGVLGANFIFLSSINDNLKDVFFPIKEFISPNKSNQNGQNGGSKKKKFMGGDNNGPISTSEECNKKFSETNKSNLNSIGIGKGWPYTMKNDTKVSIKGTFTDWFANTIEGSYITNRGFLRSWLELFEPPKEKSESNIFSNETFKMFFITPLTLLFTPLVLIFGFVFTFISTFDFNKHLGWSLIGLFFGLSCSISAGVSFLQFMQYFLTFTLLPLYSNSADIKNILKCHANALSYLFGLFVCINAFSSLDSMTAIVMTVVYALMVIKDLFF
jgi:hypothetical protein